MFANVEREKERERERDWCRHIKVNIPSAERERERDVLVLFEFRQFSSFFFYSGFQSLCRSLQNFKKSDRTRCLAVSILEYNINWNSEGRTK